MTTDEYETICQAMSHTDYTKLKNIKEAVSDDISYDKIKMVRKMVHGI
jgi:hypothetical protein